MKPTQLKISPRQTAMRRIGIVAFPGSQILDIAGPLAVFAEANQFCQEGFNAKQAAYQIELISTESDRLVDCYCGVNITAQTEALVEEDLGAELALRVARALVVFLRRPGSQSQFSASLSLQTSDRTPLRELHVWLLDNLREPLTVEQMAARVGMSPRNFARVFAEQIGVTPARFVMQIRVEAARRRLEESSQSIELIAEECGFGSAESMRSAFQRQMRVSPQEYRKRFHIAEPGEYNDESITQSPRLRQSGDGRDHQRRHRRPAGKPGKGKNRREQTAS
jgi:transcriptional regulator GlxA family with amidase domain